MTDEKKPDDKPEENQEIDESALFDAVSEAVDEVTITPAKDDDPKDDDPKDDDPKDDDPKDDDPKDDDPKDDDPKDDDPKDDDPKDDDPKDDDPKDDDPKDDDPKDDDLKDGDPLNDPIPESTNEKTAERIKSLIGLVKNSNESVGQRDEILEQITQTGTDADQYANTLGFLKLYNSRDTGERKQALAVARGLVKELALELGEGSTVTKLTDHEDLSAEVEAGTLSEARALEIAATREADKLRTAKDAAVSDANATASTTQQNLATGKAQLDVFETAVRTNDENYAAIRPAFIKLLGPILKRTHPTEWGAAAQEVYDQVKTFAPAATPKPKPKPKNEPLRPKQGAGSSDKTSDADTALGAVDDALANM